VLRPNQFRANEAWIAFQLNGAPIDTETDGSFNCFALMDAASCLILCSELFPATAAEPSKGEVRRLLKQASAHKGELPVKLFVPVGQFATILPAEARRQGLTVVRASEDELALFIGEARTGFEEYVSGKRCGNLSPNG
jgi:hypothetical protein